MLVLDPTKRLSLDKVLKHRWITQRRPPLDKIDSEIMRNPIGTKYSTRPVQKGSTDDEGGNKFIWDEQVLECMNRMGYNVDKVKDVSCFSDYPYLRPIVRCSCIVTLSNSVYY